MKKKLITKQIKLTGSKQSQSYSHPKRCTVVQDVRCLFPANLSYSEVPLTRYKPAIRQLDEKVHDT